MPCGPICPASDALCIAGFKTGWRLWPPTRASFLGRGQATQKNTLEASKGNQNQPYLIQLGEGLPTLSLPPCLVSVAQFSFFPQLYQIQLVLVTLRLAAKGGPPDRNSPNLHMEKYRLPVSTTSLSPTVSDTAGSAPPPRDGPGGIRASDLKAPSLNCLVVHPPNPESKIQNSPIQNPKSKLFRPHFGDFGFWTLDFGFWIVM